MVGVWLSVSYFKVEKSVVTAVPKYVKEKMLYFCHESRFTDCGLLVDH